MLTCRPRRRGRLNSRLRRPSFRSPRHGSCLRCRARCRHDCRKRPRPKDSRSASRRGVLSSMRIWYRSSAFSISARASPKNSAERSRSQAPRWAQLILGILKRRAMASASPISVQAFQAPKEGNTPEQCEDAFGADPARGRFAVADGASESFAAGEWARQLADGFVREEGPWNGWLKTARSAWLAAFQGQKLSWFAETKLQEGAHAALLGLEIQSDGTWQADSVGDASLFQVRADGLVQSFPMLRAADYSNRPELICSRTPDGEEELPLCLLGDWRTGDCIYLATDALALWFLTSHEKGGRPWRLLREITDLATF